MAARPVLTASVSLLHNNLQSSPSGWLAAVHNSASAGASKVLLHFLGNGGSKDGPDAAQVTSVRYHTLPWGSIFCVCSTHGTKIYNEDCMVVHFYRQVHDPTRPADMVKNHQGSCLIPSLSQVVIGSSKGSLLVVNAASPDQMAAVSEPQPCEPAPAEIADLCFSEIANTVITAHNDGGLRVWSLDGSGNLTNTQIIDLLGAQAPVRIQTLGPRLAVAYGTGAVRLYDAMSLALQAEITAHARWLTAMTVREELGQIATVGEDTVLNVWQVEPTTGQVSLSHSSVVADKLLTGVAFHGNAVIVTAYDASDLFQVML